MRRLVDFPYVLVRIRCNICKRAGAYRLARLAVKFGSEILLDDLLVRLSADCPWQDEPRAIDVEHNSAICRRVGRRICRYPGDCAS